jgi:hypothetical protein
LDHEHGAKFQKLEDPTSSVVLEQEDKVWYYDMLVFAALTFHRHISDQFWLHYL